MVRLIRLENRTGYYYMMVRVNNSETVFKKAIEKNFIKLLQNIVENSKIAVAA